MKDSFWLLICLILCFPALLFGIRNLVVYKKLSNKKLTAKTDADLNNYEHKKNVLARRRVIPNLTSFQYTYTVDGKKYKLDFRLESKPTSKDLQRTIHVVYLKSNPKYAYCELTHLNYAISGWLLLIAGIVLSLIFIIGFIFSM